MSLSAPNLQQLASGLPQEVQTALRSALAAQDRFNRDVLAYLAQAAIWQTPTLLNGWVPYSTARAPAYTRLANGLVVIHGAIKNGVAGVVFRLPGFYQPVNDLENFVQWSDAGGVLFRLYVTRPDGDVVVTTAATAEVSLNCCFMGAV